MQIILRLRLPFYFREGKQTYFCEPGIQVKFSSGPHLGFGYIGLISSFVFVAGGKSKKVAVGSVLGETVNPISSASLSNTSNDPKSIKLTP